MTTDQIYHSVRLANLKTAPAKPSLKKPSLYKVIILNDDYTPMDFVVEVLQLFFRMNHGKATQLMMRVHLTGHAVCGIFSREIAETKVENINTYARNHQHPLLSVMEPNSNT